MEAYSQVYTSSENLQEEIQEWANSLIEEGYNLSEYTSDELYEAYIEEQGRSRRMSPEAKARRAEAQAQTNVQRAQAPTLPTPRPGGGGRGSRGRASAYQAVARDKGAGGDAAYRAGGGDAAARSGRSRQEIQAAGMSAIRAKPAATPVSTKPAVTPAAAKPAATPAAAKPAVTPAAAKPAATPAAAKPAATPAATSSTPAKPSLSSQASELRQMRARSLERQGKTLDAATVSATAKPTAFQANSFDVFDLVKGYLLDEGYAETEEGAMVMMVNMSEGWRESILEVLGGQSGDGYIGHPRLGIKNPMSAPKKPVTSAPKNTGVAGQLGNRAAAMDAAMKQLRNSYEAEGEQLDEISTKLAGKVVNARIERTGAAADRENKVRTPQNVRDTVAAADKEARAKKLAAGVRKRRSATNEQLESWVEELTAEGYDLSGYTQEEIAEIYAQELELAESDSIAAMRERAAKRRKQRYGASDTSRGGRDDFKPYTEDDYKRGEKNNPRNTRKEEYVDESQHARENPEDHDKEEKKKYEKVRGEKTPMPPRGDKRREDFEKWYAANVR
jgi:hypothetical protein